VYDHLNRLLRRNDEFFVHDGWQIVLTLDSKGKIKDQYLWGANQDELLCENGYWTLCDHLGTVRDVVNKNSKIVSHLEYSSFGELLKVSGIKPRFRYTGKITDDVNALQWNINRWYDAKIGRWCSEDTIGFRGRDTNLVRYARSNIIELIDPSGLYWVITRVGQSRAIAKNLNPNDTILQLAKALLLNEEEYNQWLKAEDGKPLPDSEYNEINSCRRFSVPNTAVYYKAKRSLLDISVAVTTLQIAASLYLSELSLSGYKTIENTTGEIADFKSNFKDTDTDIFIFAGHGNSSGLIYGTDGNTIAPSMVSRPFKLAGLRLGACYSANAIDVLGAYPPRAEYWSKHLSKRGIFEGGDGMVFLWSDLVSWVGPTPPSP
jgi:RHS repeat-associated protein